MLCSNIVLNVKTKTNKKLFLYTTCCELLFFGEFNEQSLLILWINWCKNVGFWKRFTCTFTVISKSKNVCSVYHQNFFNESYPSYLANFDILNVFFHFTQFQSDSLFQSGQLWFVYYSLLVSGLQNNETHFSATMQVFNHGTLYLKTWNTCIKGHYDLYFECLYWSCKFHGKLQTLYIEVVQGDTFMEQKMWFLADWQYLLRKIAMSDYEQLLRTNFSCIRV